MRRQLHRRDYYIVAAALVALAFGLRLWGLTATSLWYDETFVLYHAQQGVIAGTLGLLREDNALPLHGLLLALWITVAGSGEFAVRYLSVLLGTIAAALVLRLGGAVQGKRYGGWGAVLAYATLPIYVYYTQEVRMYAPVIPLAAAFTWTAWRIVERGKGGAAYVILGAAMMTAHLYAGLLWVAVLVWGSYRVQSPKSKVESPKSRIANYASRITHLGWWRANVGLGLVALPVAAWAVWRAQTDATAVSAIPVEALRWIPMLFGVGQYLSAPWAWLFVVIAALARQAQGTWAVGIVDEWHPRPDFRGVARYIEARSTPDDAIVVIGGYAAHTLDYYYNGPAHLFGLPFDTRVLDTSRPLDLRVLATLEQQTATSQRLWLVLWQDRLADPTALVLSLLVEGCRRLPVDAQFTNVGVILFDLTTCGPLDQLASPPHPLSVDFAEPIRLTGYDLIKTGEMWEVNLWWETSGPLPTAYLVFVHLIGPDGTQVAQHDHIAGADAYHTGQWMPGTVLRDRFFLNVPGGACPGCTLRVGLYTDQGRLPLRDGGDTVIIELAE